MMRLLAATSVLFLLGACGVRVPTTSSSARVRNQPPATCTQADFAACPAVAVTSCPDGQDPVIDYSSDCCGHASCQTACVPGTACAGWPAPVCPAGTTLTILTTEACCPAYQCQPATACDQVDVLCPLAMPYCGPSVQPAVVGYTDACCPIYQCPCATDLDAGVAPGGPPVCNCPNNDPTCVCAGTDGGTPTPVPDPTLCGCTYPTCAAGEQLECLGLNICGYPCTCVAATSNCTTDADCGPNMYCALAPCAPDPTCDPSTGTTCTTSCGGQCVGYVQTGCKADSECPTGQTCQLECMGWGCANAGPPGCSCPANDPTCNCATTDGGTPTPAPAPCATCAADDPTCACAADGSCSGQTCTGQCMPTSVCNGVMNPAACPMQPAMPCDNPTQVGADPTTCCPIYQCPSCTATGAACPIAMCYCGVPTGTDANCCPVIACPNVTSPTACPAACRADADCAAGQACGTDGFCSATP